MAKKRLQWRDSVLSFAPKPHARTPSITEPRSSSEVDRRDEEEGVDYFYDAETGLESMKSCSEEDSSPRDEIENVVFKEQSAVINDAAACLSTCSKDVESTDVDEKKIIQNDQSEHAAVIESSSAMVADAAASDSSSTLNSTEDPHKAEVVTREITTLPLQKLKLLKKLIKQRRICKQCKVKFDLECEELVLTGTADDVTTTEVGVYEALANASERTVNISKELGRLIASPKGQRWFDENCERCSFVGVCYVVDDFVTKLLAADDAVVDAMRKWFTDALLSERKSLGLHHVSFLESNSWMDFVRKFTEGQLVVIVTDVSKTEILVEGTVDLVKNALKEIDDLLDRNCHVTKKLPLKHADFQTLSFCQSDILNEIQDLVMQQHR